MLTATQQKPEQLAYSIVDAAWLLGDISPGHVRNLISAGQLQKVRIGRRVMVTASSIKQLLGTGNVESGSNDEQEAA